MLLGTNQGVGGPPLPVEEELLAAARACSVGASLQPTVAQARRLFLVVGEDAGTGTCRPDSWFDFRGSNVSSTENVSPSHKITARSTTFPNRRFERVSNFIECW